MFIEALAAPVFVVIGNSHAFEEFVDCDYRRIYKRIALFFHYQKRATIRLKLHALIINDEVSFIRLRLSAHTSEAHARYSKKDSMWSA